MDGKLIFSNLKSLLEGDAFVIFISKTFATTPIYNSHLWHPTLLLLLFIHTIGFASFVCYPFS